MEYEFRDGRLYLTRDAKEKAPIVARLSRIEGQVRGLRQMVEDNRYCLDEIQQAGAISAAMRETVLLILADHLNAGVDFAVNGGDGDAVKDMIAVLRGAMRQQL
jgi:DNA-binding FrmR family transcriptional regulator